MYVAGNTNPWKLF